MYAHEFGKLIQLFSKDYRQQMEMQLSPSLTEGQLHVLEILHTRDVMKPSDFVEILDTTPAAVTTLFDRMEKHQLIQRVRDMQDRRIVWIHMTAHGHAELHRGKAIREKILQTYLSRLSSHNQQLFIYLFSKVSSTDDHKSQGN